MKQFLAVVFALAALGASRATACDGVAPVAPTAFVSGAFVAPVAVNVVPATVVAPLAVQVNAVEIQAATPTVQVLAVPARVRACVAPRVRVLQRPVRSRVTVRVR